MNKAEYVCNNNQWTPVGQCYLCDNYDEVRMVISGAGNVHPVCAKCVKAHEVHPAQPTWYMTAVMVLAIIVFITALVSAVVALSRIAGGP